MSLSDGLEAASSYTPLHSAPGRISAKHDRPRQAAAKLPVWALHQWLAPSLIASHSVASVLEGWGYTRCRGGTLPGSTALPRCEYESCMPGTARAPQHPDVGSLDAAASAECRVERTPRAARESGPWHPAAPSPERRKYCWQVYRHTYIHTCIQGRDHVPISRDAEPLALQRIVAPAALPPHRVDLN